MWCDYKASQFGACSRYQWECLLLWDALDAYYYHTALPPPYKWPWVWETEELSEHSQLLSPFCFFRLVSKAFYQEVQKLVCSSISTYLPNLIVCSRYKMLVLCSHHSQQLQRAVFQVEWYLIFFLKLPSDWESISSASSGLSSDNFF